MSAPAPERRDKTNDYGYFTLGVLLLLIGVRFFTTGVTRPGGASFYRRLLHCGRRDPFYRAEIHLAVLGFLHGDARFRSEGGPIRYVGVYHGRERRACFRARLTFQRLLSYRRWRNHRDDWLCDFGPFTLSSTNET